MNGAREGIGDTEGLAVVVAETEEVLLALTTKPVLVGEEETVEVAPGLASALFAATSLHC